MDSVVKKKSDFTSVETPVALGTLK